MLLQLILASCCAPAPGPVFSPAGVLEQPAPFDPFGVLRRESQTGPCAVFPPPPEPRCRLTVKTVYLCDGDGCGWYVDVFRDGRDLGSAEEVEGEDNHLALNAILGASPSAAPDLHRVSHHKWTQVALIGAGSLLLVSGALTWAAASGLGSASAAPLGSPGGGLGCNGGACPSAWTPGQAVVVGLGIGQLVLAAAAYVWAIVDVHGGQRFSMERAVDDYNSDLIARRLRAPAAAPQFDRRGASPP